MALSISGAVALLSRTPTALFAIALGLAGLGSAMRVASKELAADLLLAFGDSLLVVAAAVLVIDVILYALKLIRSRSAVLEDLTAPTQANLLAPGFMAAMVIGSAWHDTNDIGGLIWLLASVGHFALLLGFVGRWLTHDFVPENLNPTWFLPAAGIMTSPMTWPGYGPAELPIILLAVGGTLWVMLLPLVFRRIVFEPAVPAILRPTLFIIAAPFGLAAGALITLFPDPQSRIPFALLSGGAFFILVLMTQVRFLSKAGIVLSWWATTFPVATIAAGFFRIDHMKNSISLVIGGGLLALACLTTLMAVLATLQAARHTCVNTVSRTERQISAMQGKM